MDALLAAARLGDPVAHTASKGWMIAGLIGGALLGAAVVTLTGGTALIALAAVAAGAAAGGGIGEVLGTMSWAPRHVTGSLISGSPNVFVNSRSAMRAHISSGVCSDHQGAPKVIAQGSSTVFINGQPAARKEDLLTCSAVINDGSPNVFIGGSRTTTDDISPEVPAWMNWAMLAVGVAAVCVLAGPIVAALGIVGGLAGGELGSLIGGHYFGDRSDGQKWSMLAGSLAGGYAGGEAGGSLAEGMVGDPVSAGGAFAKGGAPEAMARENAISKITSGVGDDFKNNPLRAEYESRVAGLSDYERTLKDQDLSQRDVAQSMHQARRELGVEYKDATPEPLRDYIYDVNQERYGDPLGPSFESLEDKYNGNYKKIIDAAKRPNPDVNKLLNGFTDWLGKQPSSTLAQYNGVLGSGK
jgi:uncharacterized Zn-binding protein involved in type VI secretion